MKEKFSFNVDFCFIFHECSSLNMRFTINKKTKQMKPNRPDNNNSSNSISICTDGNQSFKHTMTGATQKMEMALFCYKWKQVLFFCLLSLEIYTWKILERADQTRVRGRERGREKDQLQCSLININRLEEKKN